MTGPIGSGVLSAAAPPPTPRGSAPRGCSQRSVGMSVRCPSRPNNWRPLSRSTPASPRSSAAWTCCSTSRQSTRPRRGRTSNAVTSARPRPCGSGRWTSSRTWCDVTCTTSRSRTSPTLRCTRCSGRSETRSPGRSPPWRIATRHGSCTGHSSSTERSRRRCVGRGGAARDHPPPGAQHRERHGRGVRGRGPCGVRSLPRRVSGLPGRTSRCATTSPS